MTSYKARFGITLKAAKQIAINNNGRLPRPGYKTPVKYDTVKLVGRFNGVKRNHPRIVYLVNQADKFSLEEHISVNCL